MKSSTKGSPRGIPKPRNPSPAEIAAAILGVLAERDPGKTICPSEAARRLDPDHWRRLMTPVREVAKSMVREGRLEIRRKGEIIDPLDVRGVIRLALPQE
ncbi:MAG: DUF3253 domain-containing protein [Pseudomonadota bacterium]